MSNEINEQELERANGPTEVAMRKWAPVLESGSPIKDTRRKRDLVRILENTEQEMAVARRAHSFLNEAGPTNSMGTSSSVTGSGPIDTYDPIIVSLLRRAMPNLIVYDVAGVQAMTGPTGLVFAKRTRLHDSANNGGFSDQRGDSETFYNEPNTGFSSIGGANAALDPNIYGGDKYGANTVYANGTSTGGYVAAMPGTAASDVQGSNTAWFATQNNAPAGGSSIFNYATGLTRTQLEGLGSNSSNLIFPQMDFTIEKVTVEAVGRALKAEYSMEMAQDLKAIHGLDAETELSNDLAAEILSEINREVIRTIYVTAVPGAQNDTTTPGMFDLDVDSNGRWSVEKFKGLMFQIDRDANAIAKQTRRGRGNILICSSDVADAMNAAGRLSLTPNLDGNNLAVDDTGPTFVGILNGRYKVFVDPYSPVGFNFYVGGYKGAGWTDAGLFYCPYTPLQMVRAVDPNTFQPKIGFKTRYGIVANPYAGGLQTNRGAITQDSNLFYRRVVVNHLM